MTTNWKYDGDALAAVVWLTTSAKRAHAGEISWEEAAREAWAMSADKANRVQILVAVDDADIVVGSWRVVGVHNEAAAPAGKTREVNRSRFELVADDALAYLSGASHWTRRRNPQTTMQVRDLPGAAALLGSKTPDHGVVLLGGFTLQVRADGNAELTIPRGALVTIRQAG